jgi:ADP-heptose:LPS heptosyltransferase
MSKKRRSKFSLWKNYYRRVWPVLGPACHGDEHADGTGGVLLMKRDNIGDFVLSTTFMNMASGRWAHLPVTLVCSPAVADIAKSLYPHWTVRRVQDDFGEYKKSRWRPGPLQRSVRAWPVVDRLVNLRATRFQEEVIFDSWVPARNKVALRNLFNYHAASYRIAPDERIYSQVLAPAVAEIPRVCREIAGYRKLLSHFFPDERTGDIWPRLNFGKESGAVDQAIVEKGFRTGSAIAFCPFPSAAIKRYPVDVLITIVSRLARRYQLGVDILGGPSDRKEAAEIARRIDCPNGARSFAGDFSLIESLRAVAGARAVLGVDTGLMHAAVAAGTPSVIIMGGGHYGHFGPWGDPRRAKWLSHPMPCYDCNWECTQAEPFCIRSIPPQLIESSLCALLDNT